MAKRRRTPQQDFGVELGESIRQGLQGLNTYCSPKKRKVCIRLIAIPLILSVFGLISAANMQNVESGTAAWFVVAIGLITGLPSMFLLGLYQFYVGRVFKGILFTITCGGFWIGCLIDLFKLTVTKTFKDANGFPLIY